MGVFVFILFFCLKVSLVSFPRVDGIRPHYPSRGDEIGYTPFLDFNWLDEEGRGSMGLT